MIVSVARVTPFQQQVMDV